MTAREGGQRKLRTGRKAPTVFDLLPVLGPVLVFFGLLLTGSSNGNSALGLLVGVLGVGMLVAWWMRRTPADQRGED